VINVHSSWDRKAGQVLPKTRAGRRAVPIARALRRELRAHVFRCGRRTGLVFGRTDEMPFSHSGVQDRADRAWRNAGLERISYHECRHTFASLLIAAGLSAQRNPMAIAKELAQYVGHASVTQCAGPGDGVPYSAPQCAALLSGRQRSSAVGRDVW
jgi:integrase